MQSKGFQNSTLKVGTRSQWADFQLLDDFGASSNCVDVT
jgi:hypothetical protein